MFLVALNLLVLVLVLQVTQANFELHHKLLCTWYDNLLLSP